MPHTWGDASKLVCLLNSVQQSLSMYSSTAMVVIVALVHYLLTKPAKFIREFLTDSGADLPLLTKMMFPDSAYYWIIPGIALLMVVLNVLKLVSKRAAISVSGLLTVVSIILFIVGLYLPMYQLGSVVGANSP